jgi:hypothetical protein
MTTTTITRPALKISGLRKSLGAKVCLVPRWLFGRLLPFIATPSGW